jgi:hypothetical protein
LTAANAGIPKTYIQNEAFPSSSYLLHV